LLSFNKFNYMRKQIYSLIFSFYLANMRFFLNLFENTTLYIKDLELFTSMKRRY